MRAISTMRNDIRRLVAHYSGSLKERGVIPEGVLWPNAPDLAMRFEILLGAAGLGKSIAARPVRLLDLGCGPAFLLDYLAANQTIGHVDYTGVDVAEVMIGHARARWPHYRFELRDVR